MELRTQRLRLTLQTREETEALLAALSDYDRAQVSADWLARLRVSQRPDPWTLPFRIVLDADGVQVGTCGFKGPPANGIVEIAYGIEPDHQGNGYATEAAQALVEYARTCRDVRLVRAHTLPEGAASKRVLEKCRFSYVGEVHDPDDGRVARFERRADTRAEPTSSLDGQALRTELLAMAAEDLRVRNELARDGSLYEGYHPRMREVHDRNAKRLQAVLDRHGWPGRASIGEEAAEAAWLILQHAIAHPDLQRRGLALLADAAARGDVPPSRVAYLEDRIRCNEGKRQRYGTQFDWDRNGMLNPLPIEDEGNVDARRSEVGLAPLAEDIPRMRQAAARSGERAPRDWEAREREKAAWLRSTGWRD